MPSESVASELHGMRYEASRYRGDKIYGIGFGRPFEGETCMDKEPSWETPRRAHFTHEEDVAFLRRTIKVSRDSRSHGNTLFGDILVDEHKNIVLEQENVKITEHRCIAHAETMLADWASHEFDRDYLWQCMLYTTAEPCAMCVGAIYWANIGRVVFAMTERDLLAMTGSSEQNPTMDIPARSIFASSQKNIEVIGPFPELIEEAAAVHVGYWGE